MRKMFVIVILLAGAVWAQSSTQPDSHDAGGDQGQPRTVLHVYNIRDYLLEPGNYPLNPASQRPMTRPVLDPIDTPDFNLNEGGNAPQNPPPQTQPAVSQSNPASENTTLQDQLDALVKLITTTIFPDTWRDAGGSIGSITELNGKLYVTTTPEAQAQVQKVIEEVTANANRTVHVRAAWLLLTDDELAALSDPAGQPGAINRLSEPAFQKAKPIARAELLCIDSQTVHITAGPRQEHIALQIQPQVTASGKEVFLDVQNSVADHEQFCTTARIPLGAEVVIGGITANQGGKDQPNQLYLVMRVDAP
jgi:hypothetical protein